MHFSESARVARYGRRSVNLCGGAGGKMRMPKTLAVALLVLAAKVELGGAASHAASAQFSDVRVVGSVLVQGP